MSLGLEVVLADGRIRTKRAVEAEAKGRTPDYDCAPTPLHRAEGTLGIKNRGDPKLFAETARGGKPPLSRVG